MPWSFFRNTSHNYVPISNNRSSIETNGSQSDAAPLLPQSPSAGRTNGPLKALQNWRIRQSKSQAQLLRRAIRAREPIGAVEPSVIDTLLSQPTGTRGDLNAPSKHGRTALHTAVELGQLGPVKALIEQGGARSVINARDYKGRTPFYQAARKENTPVMDYLHEKEADINAADQKGNTPVHRAINDENWDVMTWLCSKGADLNRRNKEGHAPLHTVLMDKRLTETDRCEKLEILLSNGAHPDVTTENGDTSLHLATVTNQLDVVKLLCDYGANTEKENAFQRTPERTAIMYRRTEIHEAMTAARSNPSDQRVANLHRLRGEQAVQDAPPLYEQIEEPPPSYEQEQAAVSTDVEIGNHVWQRLS